MKNKQTPFWLFIFSVFSALLLPALLQDGMFLDGLVNSSISRNMANGEGSFWLPQYSKTFANPFYGHPPLAFWVQSLFFKLFGDHLFVERFYSFLTAIITGIFIIKIWKHVFRNEIGLATLGWLPFLFWIITPVVFWSYANNMLENTMTIFDLAATCLIIKALDSNSKVVLRLIFAGIMILAAFLSKGPVGLFPLATVPIYWLIFKKKSFSQTIIYSTTILFTPLLVLLLLFLFEPNSLNNIVQYLDEQIVPSLQGKRELASSRYYIIKRLFNELIPIILLSLIIFFLGWKKGNQINTTLKYKRLFIFYLTLALSASIPIMVSVKQSGFYLVPSFPYFAIAGGIFIGPSMYALTQKINTEGRLFRTISTFIIILFSGILVFSFMQTGKVRRDKDLIRDIYTIGKIIPPNSVISICHDISYHWGLHAYMERYFNISLEDKIQNEYFLTIKNCNNNPPEEYLKMEINTSIYEVYKRK